MEQIAVSTEPLRQFNKTVIMGQQFLETYLYTGKDTYKLMIPPGRFEFCLTLPDKSEVSDTFIDMDSRESLYRQIENGRVYDWLKDVQQRIGQLDEAENIHTISVPVEHYCYYLKVDVLKKECWVLCPQSARRLNLSELYSTKDDI